MNILGDFHHHHCLSALTSLSWAFLLRATHVMPTSFISLSMHLLHVSRGLPLPLEPCGFHWRACRVILFLPFLNVCPTHFHLRLPISLCIGTCPVLSHTCSFLILSIHFSFKIFLKHLLTNTWSSFMTPFVVFQVSQPYSSILGDCHFAGRKCNNFHLEKYGIQVKIGGRPSLIYYGLFTGT